MTPSPDDLPGAGTTAFGVGLARGSHVGGGDAVGGDVDGGDIGGGDVDGGGGDIGDCAHEAAARALGGLAGAPVDLAAVFVSGDDPMMLEHALERASRTLSAAHVIGCSAGGVLSDGHGVEGEVAVSVWAAALPGASLRSFHLEVIQADDSAAVVGMPDPRPDERTAILLVDPWSFPVDAFLARGETSLPGVAFVGGLASGVGGPASSRLLVDGRVVSRGAVGVLLGGGVAATPVVSHGCRPLGPAIAVTRGAGQDIHELAGQPALRRLEEILAGLEPPERDLAAAGLQLGIAVDEYADEHGFGDFLVRGILGADPASGSLRIGDEISVGQTVRFHVRDALAAGDHLRGALSGQGDDAGGVLMFSCNGRGSAMFASADHDPAVVASLPGHPAVGGFFAAGELGPVGRRSLLHTFTASMLVFPRG